MTDKSNNLPEICIDSVWPWGLPDLKEVYRYRDLLYFTVWRVIRVSYAQSVGGYAWAVIQPAVQIVIFSVVFGGLLGLDGGNGMPYPLFVTVAVVPWSYMQTSVTAASSVLLSNAAALGKVYFPRLLWLLAPIFSNLIQFSISFLLIIGVLFIYQVSPTLNLLMLPLLIVLMMLLPLAFGLLLSTLVIRYRDFNIVIGLFLRMLIYFVPVMYPSSQIPEDLRQYYILNPFVGIVEGFGACLLGSPFQLDSLVSSIVVTLILLLTGAIYFRRMERIIVDVI